MTTQPNTGSVPPAPPLAADESTLAEARANCAARQRERGDSALAASYERGEQDRGFAMLHEVNRLRAERGS